MDVDCASKSTAVFFDPVDDEMAILTGPFSF